MSEFTIDSTMIDEGNRPLLDDHRAEFDALGSILARRGHDIDRLIERIAAFTVAVPSWGVGTGGTRFGRFPGPGEP